MVYSWRDFGRALTSWKIQYRPRVPPPHVQNVAGWKPADSWSFWNEFSDWQASTLSHRKSCIWKWNYIVLKAPLLKPKHSSPIRREQNLEYLLINLFSYYHFAVSTLVWERGIILRRKSKSSPQNLVSKSCRGRWKQAWFNLETSPVDCASLAAISMFGEERAQTFMKGPSNVVHRVDEVVCCSQRHRVSLWKRLKLMTGWWRMTLNAPQNRGQTSGGASWKPARGPCNIGKWKHKLLFPFLLIEHYRQ